jgi:hypothetical protein
MAQKVKIVPTFKVAMYLLYQGPIKNWEEKNKKNVCRVSAHMALGKGCCPGRP